MNLAKICHQNLFNLLMDYVKRNMKEQRIRCTAIGYCEGETRHENMVKSLIKTEVQWSAQETAWLKNVMFDNVICAFYSNDIVTI